MNKKTRASWNGKVLAESDSVEIVEGNVYFPPGSINREYFKESNTIQHAPGRGWRITIHLKLMENKMRMPHGTIPHPRRLQNT